MVSNHVVNSVSQIKIEHTDFEGLYVIHPHIYNDFRGMYKKIFHKSSFEINGIPTIYSETSDIVSKKGAIRGLHYQTVDSQAKLVHAINGRIYDVALDLRPSSKTFGKCFEKLLDSKDNLAVFIPEGFAHGFLSLDDDTIFSYQCTGQYHPESCGGILWNDKKLGINWPIGLVDNILITEKDKSWPTFDEYLVKERGDVCKEF